MFLTSFLYFCNICKKCYIKKKGCIGFYYVPYKYVCSQIVSIFIWFSESLEGLASPFLSCLPRDSLTLKTEKDLVIDKLLEYFSCVTWRPTIIKENNLLSLLLYSECNLDRVERWEKRQRRKRHIDQRVQVLIRMWGKALMIWWTPQWPKAVRKYCIFQDD